jgi:alanyl-tRNA synthetase
MTTSGADIREKFVSYFRDKRGHLYLPSASLIPDNPTLLLTSAGMVPFVPIFLGQAPPPEPPRVVTVQKVARAGGKQSDIENIGRTARHHSFFEMLGNFSFGDYFKKEVIPWAWEFVTKDLGLDPERISISIFAGDELNAGDEEAFEIWNKVVGVPAERIHRLSRHDNFWGPPGPTGPCGPCSELYYDRGPEYASDACKKDPSKCGIGKCECDRYLEFWNLVFMELFKDESGKYTPLTKKNIDTGAGLERLATILQNKKSVYETDLLLPIIETVAKISGVKYGAGKATDVYFKIIADHARCVTFLVGDGVRVSNIGRGYVLRFIIRRAARFGRLLGLKDPFIYQLVPVVASIYGDHYTTLKQDQELIASLIKEEELRFAKTIERGSNLLTSLLESNAKELPGDEVFNLYATFGFPLELTAEIAAEQGKSIDMAGFEAARKIHEEVSSVNKFNVILTGQQAYGKVLKESGPTKFSGYEGTEGEGTVVAIVKEGKEVGQLEENEEAEVVLDRTPFYAESGGQTGDTGQLAGTEGTASVLDTRKHEGLHLHRVRALSGVIEPGSKVQAQVDKQRRQDTMLHHSAAHVFHAAIRKLLGHQVAQAGSAVGPDTMRFDFTFDRQVSPAELSRIESQMNEWVRENMPVTTVEMAIEEAKKTGAIAMFGEKYGNIVRVVRMGDFSLEFCGGTHVSSTGEIGPIKIVSEGSIASGVRRIEAVAGMKAWNFISSHMGILSAAAGYLKTRPAEMLAQLERLQDELKQRDRLTQTLSEKLALAQVDSLLSKAVTHNGLNVIIEIVDDIDAEGLKVVADALRRRGENMVVVLGSALAPDKVAFAAGVSDALVKHGFSAGDLVKQAATVCGGGGGGKPQLAQAGGKYPSKLKESLDEVRVTVLQGAKTT